MKGLTTAILILLPVLAMLLATPDGSVDCDQHPEHVDCIDPIDLDPTPGTRQYECPAWGFSTDQMLICLDWPSAPSQTDLIGGDDDMTIIVDDGAPSSR